MNTRSRAALLPLYLACAMPLPASGNALEEIVVYARKTVENKQSVPISLIVNTGRDLEQAEIVQFTDITKVTPGLTIVSDDPTSTSMKIRGVGLAFFGLAADPGVVITVDEFPQSRIGSVFGAFLDVGQVEVLKGPQGTLYGRNAPSGVISIRSKQPDHEGLHGRVDVSSSSFNTFTGEAAVNVPLIDDMLAMRIAYLHTETDGYVNLARYEREPTVPGSFNYRFTGQTTNADEQEGDNARATLLFEPTENLTLLGRVNYTDYNNGQVSAVADGPMRFTEDSAVIDSAGDVYVADRDDNLMFQDNLDYSDFELLEEGLRIQWSTEVGDLISLSQFQDFKTELSETIDAKPVPLAQPRVLTSTDELFSQELRWHSNIGDRFRYLAGLFFAEHDITITYQQLETATGQLITVSGDQENKSFAVFGNAEYDVTEQISVSLGARYNDEQETIDGDIDLSAILPGGSDLQIGNIEDKTLDNNTSYSFKLRYQHDDERLFYFAWDTAYKSGGYNPQVANLPSVFPGNDNIADLERDFLRYPAEESEAIEFGMKSTWFNQRLLFNAALFYQEFENFQNFQSALSERIGGFSVGVLINAAEEITTQGLELETHWIASDNLGLTLTTSYADASADDWSTNFCDDDDNTADPQQLYCPLSNGERLNDDPKWTATFKADYRTLLPGTELEFASHLTFSYQGEAGGDNDTSRGIVDLNMGVGKDGWSVKLWSRNLLDEKEYNGNNTESEVEGIDNFYLARNIAPRSVGVTAIYAFGGE